MELICNVRVIADWGNNQVIEQFDLEDLAAFFNPVRHWPISVAGFVCSDGWLCASMILQALVQIGNENQAWVA